MQGKEQLNDHWDKENGIYVPGKGTMKIEGVEHQFLVDEVKAIPERPGYPTSDRIITEYAEDLSQDPDITVVLLPGWGETTAQFEGDFLNILISSMRSAGYSNPKIVGFNTCGKGTADYMENDQLISGTNYAKESEDIRAMTDYMCRRDKKLGENVWVLGHSMGGLNAMAFLRHMEVRGNISLASGQTARKVNGVMAMMPSWNERLALGLSGKFLNSVKGQIPPGAPQYVTGKGNLHLTQEQHIKMMFSGQEDEATVAQYLRGNPDSARKFFDITLTFRRQWLDLFERGLAKGTEFHFLKGGQDALIPVSAVDAGYRYVNKHIGDTARVTNTEAPDLTHSFSMEIIGLQREQLEEYLAMSLGRKA